jgi:dipeptidyl aminopeptidase/acylaminoacyl peptidase
MKRIFAILSFLAIVSFVSHAQRPFNFDDMMRVRRVSDPQLSPDGRLLAFVIGDVDKNANRVINQIYTIPAANPNTIPKQLTTGTASSSAPRWSPDGRSIAYTTGGQVWTMDADGGAKRQLTRISSGASNPVWSPDGKWIAFNSDVYPECNNDQCNEAEDKRLESSKVQAKVTERLLFKHWNEWRDRKRTHVFIVSTTGGVAVDFTPGDYDSPPYAASSGVDYAFSPDSREIAYLRNFDKIEATSTNSDIIVRSLTDKSEKNITVSNRGYDASPLFTPDGKYILYRSQATATFEADRWRIMRYDRSSGQTVELTGGFDQQVDEMILSRDGKTIYFSAGTRGKSPIYSLPVNPDLRLRIATHVKPVFTDGYASGLNVAPDGSIIFLSSTMKSPAEIFRINSDGNGRMAMTNINEAIMRFFPLGEAESIEWKGALNTPVQGWIIKPGFFEPGRKYPLLVLIHGGPQGAWGDSWGYRWNPQIFANAGYVVFMPNPRGSTGFGQKFVNDISGDWGGKAFIDLKNGVAEVIRTKDYVDRSRIGAAGASYGGYMVDWLLGHNNDPRFQFKAFVSHAGVYNLESMALATEETWFPAWEFKGMPWENPAMYSKWSPNKFVTNFNTPTLVTAGEQDFRVPYDQSLQLYTTLQLRNVPSKLIIFPDEGHWILKPQNSEFWYSNVLDWFGRHLK